MGSTWKKYWGIKIKYSSWTSTERFRECQLAGILKNRAEERTGAYSPYFMLGITFLSPLQRHVGEKFFTNIIQAKSLHFTSIYFIFLMHSDMGTSIYILFSSLCLYFLEFLQWVHITFTLMYINSYEIHTHIYKDFV